MDDFYDFIHKIEELHVLPGSAVDLLPEALTEQTKTGLMKRSPEDAAKMILDAIREIERGSVARVDTLIWERLSAEDLTKASAVTPISD